MFAWMEQMDGIGAVKNAEIFGAQRFFTHVENFHGQASMWEKVPKFYSCEFASLTCEIDSARSRRANRCRILDVLFGTTPGLASLSSNSVRRRAGGRLSLATAPGSVSGTVFSSDVLRGRQRVVAVQRFVARFDT